MGGEREGRELGERKDEGEDEKEEEVAEVGRGEGMEAILKGCLQTAKSKDGTSISSATALD